VARIPAVAEALGYLGGVLALVGLVLVVARYWPDVATPARLGISGAGAVAFIVAGALVHERGDPALARMRWFLWLLSTAAVALFTGVAVADGYGTESPPTITRWCATAAGAQSVALWQWRLRPIQQLTTLADAIVASGALAGMWAANGGVGFAVWSVAVLVVVVGLRQGMPMEAMVEVVGAIAAVVGALFVVNQWQVFGLLLLVATGVALMRSGSCAASPRRPSISSCSASSAPSPSSRVPRRRWSTSPVMPGR
jgi:hypothetical protein